MAQYNKHFSYNPKPHRSTEALIILERMRIRHITKKTRKALKLVKQFEKMVLVKLDDITQYTSDEWEEQNIIHNKLTDLYSNMSMRESAESIGLTMGNFLQNYIVSPDMESLVTHFRQDEERYGKKNMKALLEWFTKEDDKLKAWIEKDRESIQARLIKDGCIDIYVK